MTEKREHATELDPSESHDATYLFIRADERVQSVEADQHDIEIQFRDHKNEIAEKFREQNAMIQELLKRMDGQVSHTGRQNSSDIRELEKKMTRFETQLFDEDTGLIKQFIKGKRAAYATLIGGAGWLLTWLIQHYWK